MSTAADLERDEATRELIDYASARPADADRFVAQGPDWFGERVFGGVVIGQFLSAAMQTSDRPPHSLHAYFLRPEVPNVDVDIAVERIRDGRTFATRGVTMRQDGKELVRGLVSFHGGDPGDEYQMPMARAPEPEGLPRDENAPPPFDVRDIGPQLAADGTYISTRRVWERSGAAGDDPHDHLVIAAFMSDFTGSGFRPLTLDSWGHHADASLDHAVWFHRPFRTDEWTLFDLHALVNAAGRSTARGSFYTLDGTLVMSMAQELLIRPL